jgi:hypothetical protein
MTIKNNQQRRRGAPPSQVAKVYVDVQILNCFNNILIEDCNLHNNLDNKRNSKLPEQYAAPIIKNIKTSPVATSTAKMQTSTNFTKIDGKPSKSGTTIDLDGPNITCFAPTIDKYKHLGSTGDMQKKSSLITLLCTTTPRTQRTPELTLLPN